MDKFKVLLGSMRPATLAQVMAEMAEDRDAAPDIAATAQVLREMLAQLETLTGKDEAAAMLKDAWL